MVRYHYFKTLEEANDFLTGVQAAKGLAYYLGMTCGEHEVREIV